MSRNNQYVEFSPLFENDSSVELEELANIKWDAFLDIVKGTLRDKDIKSEESTGLEVVIFDSLPSYIFGVSNSVKTLRFVSPYYLDIESGFSLQNNIPLEYLDECPMAIDWPAEFLRDYKLEVLGLGAVRELEGIVGHSSSPLVSELYKTDSTLIKEVDLKDIKKDASMRETTRKFLNKGRRW